MKKILFSTLAASIVMLSTVQAANSACYTRDWRFSNSSARKFSAANQKILRELQGMDAAVKEASDKETEMITAAVYVLSNQKALSTEQINKALKDNTQLQAHGMQAINQAKRYQKAIRDYGDRGVGYNVCKVHTKREEIKEADESVQASIQGMVNNEVTARAGKYADRSKAMATRLALHNKYYCTEGQAAAGLCQGAGERAGKSLMASTLFEPADFLSAEYNDKSAFINNMAGLPDDPIPKNQAATVAGQAYTDLKRRKDALKSPAITSLKSIQADWSNVPNQEHHAEVSKTEKEGVISEKDQLNKEASATEEATNDADKADHGSSLMIQIKSDVARYLGGGEEYKEWSKTLTGLEEKGLLSEVVRIKALRLYMQTKQYQQLQRMEAMLAANVAAQTENSGMSARIEAERQKASRRAVRDNTGRDALSAR